MTSTQRVLKHREKQKQAGRKLVSLYLDQETVELLRSQPLTKGEIVAQAVKALIGTNRV